MTKKSKYRGEWKLDNQRTQAENIEALMKDELSTLYPQGDPTHRSCPCNCHKQGVATEGLHGSVKVETGICLRCGYNWETRFKPRDYVMTPYTREDEELDTGTWIH